MKFLDNSQKPIKIITDQDHLVENVTLKNVEFTKNLEESDVIYFTSAIHDNVALFEGKWINQFPNEIILVSKDNLASII